MSNNIFISFTRRAQLNKIAKNIVTLLIFYFSLLLNWRTTTLLNASLLRRSGLNRPSYYHIVLISIVALYYIFAAQRFSDSGLALPKYTQTIILSNINNVAEGFLSPTIKIVSTFSISVANITPEFTFNKVVTTTMIELEGVHTDYVSSSGYESKATNIMRSGRGHLLNITQII